MHCLLMVDWRKIPIQCSKSETGTWEEKSRDEYADYCTIVSPHRVLPRGRGTSLRLLGCWAAGLLMSFRGPSTFCIHTLQLTTHTLIFAPSYILEDARLRLS